MNEFQEFDWIESLPQIPNPGLQLGIGDDAAIISPNSSFAISTDSIVENSHFNSSDDPALVAKKLVKVNVSDMAAMGCNANFFLLNLHLSPNWNLEQVNQFKSGLIHELKTWNLSLIGGDTVTAKKGPIHLVGTILGQPFKGAPIRRSGAQLGDYIYVTGALGGSFPKRHLVFEPRLEWSQKLCQSLTPSAMMDISDGLFKDLGHILDQSKLSAEIDLDKIPINKDLENSENALQHAISDGEDFELLFTIKPEQSHHLPKEIPLTKIGRMISGQGEIFAKKDHEAQYNVWPRLGFEHTTRFQP